MIVPSKECVWGEEKGGNGDWHFSSEVFLAKLLDYKVCVYITWIYLTF